jgi:hypothetical protein
MVVGPLERINEYGGLPCVGELNLPPTQPENLSLSKLLAFRKGHLR